MPYDVQIRPELIKSGYADADIGYDEARKMTTLKGQDFLGANDYKNVAGSTFAERQAFDNALNKYKQGQQPIQTLQAPQTHMSSITSQQMQPDPSADQQYNDLLNALYQQAQNPQQVNVNDIYASPQYAAQQAQAQRDAQQGIRASQEAIGSAGFGRSTTLGESAQRVQNDADAFLQTQVLPQLMAQEQARRQQQFQDQFSVLDALTKERNTADQLALQEAQLTGRLMNDQDRAAQPLLNELASLGQAWQVAGSPEEQFSYRQQADRIREQLKQMGVDPSLYDPNLSTEQRIAAGQGLGTLTLGGREYEDSVREAEANARAAEAKLTTDAEKAALDSLWKAAEQTGILPNELADFYGLPRGTKTLDAEKVGISKQNADTSRMNAGTSAKNASTSAINAANSANNANIDNLMNAFKATGVAPAGLESFGINQGDALPESISKSWGSSDKIDPKESITVYNDLYDDVNIDSNYEAIEAKANELGLTPKQVARQLLEGNKLYMTDTDYKKMNDYINNNY